MASRADSGRSGVRLGKERNNAKGPGVGSKDIGESHGEMQRKVSITSPALAHQRVTPDSSRKTSVPRGKS